MVVETQLAECLERMVELRHRLHQIPEIMYEEFETAKMLRGELDRLGIAYVAGVENAPTATIAWIGDPSKPCIALRADIDALPIPESTNLPYASRHPGKMHACGHDGHMAGLMGAASIFKSMERELPVCVKLLWQPAEEGGGGAGRLVAAGALDGRIGPKVEAIFGLHGWPGLKVGLVATKPGVLLAATDCFAATFRGKGCHGAYPHLGRDPIVAACDAVTQLQQVVSREVDPTDCAVVTVGKMNGGTAINVIPDIATIEGTARSLNEATRRQLRAAIERRCAGVAAASDCTVEFSWDEGYPPTVNDPAMADYVAKVARELSAAQPRSAIRGFVPVAKPSMGGEDFSYYLEKAPGCFFLVGVEPADRENYPTLHSDLYDFTDETLAVGMRMFVELVMRWNQR